MEKQGGEKEGEQVNEKDTKRQIGREDDRGVAHEFYLGVVA